MIGIIILILNLIVIEILLSIDNCTALAAMVKHLPEKEQKKALRYGLLGAYLFRFACFFLLTWLIKIIWLKILGGIYLLYLTYKFFTENQEEALRQSKMKSFWMTVISVEIMDISLAMDNCFAAVALSSNIWIIMTGVAIGILAMRFIAGLFVKLINKYPSLNTSAFIVIGLLGIKLIVTGIVDYIPSAIWARNILESHSTDFIFSGIMMAIFFVPLLFKKK